MLKYVPYHDRERRRVPRYLHDLDLMLVTGEQMRPCHTSDVSLYGAYALTSEVEALDRVLHVRVRQGADDPIEWMGIVRRSVSPERAKASRPAGMALEIFSITEANWARWVFVIARVADRGEARIAPEIERDSGPEAAVAPRRYARHDAPVEVRLRGMPELVRFGARDISAGGVFIRPAPPLSLGEEVELQIRHPLSDETFVLEARVVRVESTGVALEFVNLSRATRDRLKRFILTGQRPE